MKKLKTCFVVLLDYKTINRQTMSESNISCHACSSYADKVYKKQIGNIIYKYCGETCAIADFVLCSYCQYTEASKRICHKQYLGGKLWCYCSERCQYEDQTDFIRSFRKSVKN